MLLDEVGEERAHPLGDVVAGLAAGAGQPVGRELPLPPGREVPLLELAVRQPLPGAVVHLLEARVGLDGHAGDDDRGRLAGPEQRARDHAVEADGRQPVGERLRLAAAGLVDRDVDPLTEVLFRLGSVGQAVAGEDEGEHRRPV